MFSTVNSSARKSGTATLEIKKFSQLTSFTHVYLSINGFPNNFFGIHPKTVVYDDECVSVYLLNLNDAFKFHVNVSIINSRGTKLFTKENIGAFGNGTTENYFSLMPRSELILPKNGYLFSDTLTLLCELEVIEKGQDIHKIRKDLNNLSENFQSLLNDEKFVDATLVVGKNRREFRVHKNILAARSSVFAAMFEHDCEEKRQNKVNITDMDEEVCAEMLSYIYTGKVKELDRYAMELWDAADKYQLDSLKTFCEQNLSSHLTIESAANVLILSDMHRASELKTKCLDYICENANKVKATDEWKVLTSTKHELFEELFDHLAMKYNK